MKTDEQSSEETHDDVTDGTLKERLGILEGITIWQLVLAVAIVLVVGGATWFMTVPVQSEQDSGSSTIRGNEPAADSVDAPAFNQQKSLADLPRTVADLDYEIEINKIVEYGGHKQTEFVRDVYKDIFVGIMMTVKQGTDERLVRQLLAKHNGTVLSKFPDTYFRYTIDKPFPDEKVDIYQIDYPSPAYEYGYGEIEKDMMSYDEVIHVYVRRIYGEVPNREGVASVLQGVSDSVLYEYEDEYYRLNMIDDTSTLLHSLSEEEVGACMGRQAHYIESLRLLVVFYCDRIAIVDPYEDNLVKNIPLDFTVVNMQRVFDTHVSPDEEKIAFVVGYDEVENISGNHAAIAYTLNLATLEVNFLTTLPRSYEYSSRLIAEWDVDDRLYFANGEAKDCGYSVRGDYFDMNTHVYHQEKTEGLRDWFSGYYISPDGSQAIVTQHHTFNSQYSDMCNDRDSFFDAKINLVTDTGVVTLIDFSQEKSVVDFKGWNYDSTGFFYSTANVTVSDENIITEVGSAVWYFYDISTGESTNNEIVLETEFSKYPESNRAIFQDWRIEKWKFDGEHIFFDEALFIGQKGSEVQYTFSPNDIDNFYYIDFVKGNRLGRTAQFLKN